MAKLHWWPWMALAEIEGRTECGLDQIAQGSRDCAPVWQPAADLVETQDAFRVTLELPGVAREDVAVEVRGREYLLGVSTSGIHLLAEVPPGKCDSAPTEFGQILAEQQQ